MALPKKNRSQINQTTTFYESIPNILSITLHSLRFEDLFLSQLHILGLRHSFDFFKYNFCFRYTLYVYNRLFKFPFWVDQMFLESYWKWVFFIITQLVAFLYFKNIYNKFPVHCIAKPKNLFFLPTRHSAF